MKVYTYKACGTCRKATQWLNQHQLPFTEIPIRETPPSMHELKDMLAAHEGDLRRLFNTSGQDYRALGIKDKLPTLSEQEALELLHSNGNLVKRPFLITEGWKTVGFKEAEWENNLI